MTKPLEALKPQAFELLIANGYEMANQLRHLADNEIDSDSFAVVIENHNGKETEFERPITELALQAAGTFDELIAAMERSEKQRESWKQIAQTNIYEREKDFSELDAARNRIAELEATLEHEREKSRRVMSQNHHLEAKK